MAELPTVRIVNPSNPDEFIIINESDYDADAHQLWDERGEPEPAGDPLAEMSVAELRDAVGDVDDESRLQALLADEDRVTAREAIEDRLEALQGGEE